MRGIKYLILGVCMLLCTATIAAATDSREINVTIDGTALTFTDAKPYADASNRTQIPLRVVSEGLNCGVIWDEYSNSVYVFDIRDNNTKAKCLNFVFDSNLVYILEATGTDFSVTDDLNTLMSKISTTGDITTFEMDTVPVAIENRTYVPLRYIATLLDKVVNWNQDTYTVEITSH